MIYSVTSQTKTKTGGGPLDPHRNSVQNAGVFAPGARTASLLVVGIPWYYHGLCTTMVLNMYYQWSMYYHGLCTSIPRAPQMNPQDAKAGQKDPNTRMNRAVIRATEVKLCVYWEVLAGGPLLDRLWGSQIQDIT